jgi:hypothetical protein
LYFGRSNQRNLSIEIDLGEVFVAWFMVLFLMMMILFIIQDIEKIVLDMIIIGSVNAIIQNNNHNHFKTHFNILIIGVKIKIIRLVFF